MEGRNDFLQSRIVLAEYRFRSVAREHMHAFCMRWLPQNDKHYAGEATRSIFNAATDVASKTTSVKVIFVLLVEGYQLEFRRCRRFGTLLA
jgi:hypothetical protein